MHNGEFQQSSVHPSGGRFCIRNVHPKIERFLKNVDYLTQKCVTFVTFVTLRSLLRDTALFVTLRSLLRDTALFVTLRSLLRMQFS